MASAYSFAPDPLARIRAEFDEMPGMRLTVAQAARLFGLTTVDCRRAFALLVRRRFLVRDMNGQYHRPGLLVADRSGLSLPRPDRHRLASAQLRPLPDRRQRA